MRKYDRNFSFPTGFPGERQARSFAGNLVTLSLRSVLFSQQGAAVTIVKIVAFPIRQGSCVSSPNLALPSGRGIRGDDDLPPQELQATPGGDGRFVHDLVRPRRGGTEPDAGGRSRACKGERCRAHPM